MSVEEEITKEVAYIEVVRYRDKDGKPTCAKNFDTGEVCLFYTAQRFGTHEACWFSDKSGKFWETMRRRNDGIGSLIPLNNCPLWLDETDEE